MTTYTPEHPTHTSPIEHAASIACLIEHAASIACIGECMIEIGTRPNDASATVTFGGDTLNTTLYLARLAHAAPHPLDVSYITSLGDDPFAAHMLTQWQQEGINCSTVEQVANRETGLYSIHLDAHGERSFRYWRANAPVREMFDGDEGLKRVESLRTYDALYFSGITLAVLHPQGRDRLLKIAQDMKDAGRTVIYDTNFRPRLWTLAEAQTANQRALAAASIALPSSEDLEGMFGPPQNNWTETLAAYDIPEIILKHGGAPLDIYTDGLWTSHTLERLAHVVDTTAAGDSFNAGFIAARVNGKSTVEAVDMGHQLASTVLQHRGAIIPSAAMPDIHF